MGRILRRPGCRIECFTSTGMVCTGSKLVQLAGIISYRCPVRHLGRFDRIAVETHTGCKRLGERTPRPRRNARPVRQPDAGCPCRLHLYRTIYSKLNVSETIREVAFDNAFGYLIRSLSVRSLRSFCSRSTSPKLNFNSGQSLKNGR